MCIHIPIDTREPSTRVTALNMVGLEMGKRSQAASSNNKCMVFTLPCLRCPAAVPGLGESVRCWVAAGAMRALAAHVPLPWWRVGRAAHHAAVCAAGSQQIKMTGPL